jgi:hypothetical protein
MQKSVENVWVKRRVRIRAYPYQYPGSPLHGKAFYVGLENGLGIGEGVPYPIRCRGGPYRGQGVGTVRPSKESLWSPTGPGCIHHQARSHPSASCAASWSAYLAALGIQVGRRRSRG